MRVNRPTLLIFISVSVYVLSLCWFAYSYLNGLIVSDMFFNADVLYLPSIFKNIFLDGKHISDWMFAPSTLLFPDALLYAFAYVLSKHAVIQILFFAILQSVSFFFFTSVLLNFFLRRSDAIAYSALVSSNIIVLGLYSADPYALSFVSVFHFGSLLSYLLLSALLLKFLSVTTTKLKLFVGFLTIFLSAFSIISDHLIELQFVAPVLLIGIFLNYGGSRNKEIFKFGILLMVGFLFAFMLEKTFLSNMGQLDYEIGFGSLTHKSMMLANWVISRPLIIQLALLLLPISLFIAIAFLIRNWKCTDSCVVKQNLFASLILVSTVLALLVTGLSNRDFAVRYLLPYIFLPPLFLFILLNEKQAKFLAAIVFCSSLLALISTHEKKATSVQLYPDVVRCVDALAQKSKVSRGIAQYWDAIPIYVFSDVGLNVVPVLADGSPTRWMYNSSEYAGKFSFAVIDNSASDFYRISRKAIEQRLTRRPFEYQCFDRTVLIFDNETISLPQQSEVSSIRSSALESFIENPRALLIMAQEEFKNGNREAATRLLSEAIALLRQSGASDETVAYYESVKDKYQP
jgi:hypothetical protein